MCGGTRWSLTVVKGNWSPKSRCRPPNDEFCGQVEKCWMALHSRLSQINRLVHRPLFEKIPYACWYWDQAYWRTPCPYLSACCQPPHIPMSPIFTTAETLPGPTAPSPRSMSIYCDHLHTPEKCWLRWTPPILDLRSTRPALSL